MKVPMKTPGGKENNIKKNLSDSFRKICTMDEHVFITNSVLTSLVGCLSFITSFTVLINILFCEAENDTTFPLQIN